MALTIKNSNGLLCPTIVCDVCGLPIDDRENGGVFYDDEKNGCAAEVLFAHKVDPRDPKSETDPTNARSCSWALDKSERRLPFCGDLGVFLFRLLNNAGYNSKKSRKELEQQVLSGLKG